MAPFVGILMAQQNSNRNSLRIFLIIYLIGSWFLFQNILNRQPAGPEQTQSILAQAQALDAEGRKADANVPEADRVKKLEDAIKKYEQFYEQNPKSPEGYQARFNEINIYDYLANLQKRSGTHWYDQAEARLKDMEKKFHGVTGSVEIERAGERTRVENVDLGELATTRLNELRAGRDVVNSDKPTYKVLDFLVNVTGRQAGFSYFFALALVVVVLKAITFPFQKKQYKYQQDMMRVAPLIREIQESMKGRPPDEVNRRVFQVYKENNVNIAGGCLPMLVLMFVLFPVFWMVRDYEYQFTNATFLWIGSEYSKQVWWLGDNLAQFDVPLFVIYLLSTVLYSLLQPKPADPQQAQQQKMMLIMMPAMFGVFMWMGQWSSAFMLYWLVLNVVSMYQSWVLMKQFGLIAQGSSATPGATPPLAGAGAGGGTVVMPQAAENPLKPMQGVHTPKQNNGNSGQRTPQDPLGRARPKGSRRR